MPGKNIFDEPFDYGTLVKLVIYEAYLKEWLPVFLARQSHIKKVIQIFDFFAGMGKDINGTYGSPLIAIRIIQSFQLMAQERGIIIILHLNEMNKKHYDALARNVKGMDSFFQMRLYNKPFSDLFEELYPSMSSSANFIFLDQSGIKEITSEIFKKIINLKLTDFLFFISSSYFKRFPAEFKKYFSFTEEEVKSTDYFHIHRKILAHYRSLISDQIYYLSPFSIKKNANIYGLIFGTNHTFGLEKFMKVAWKIDPKTGEANYDIDSDNLNMSSPFLFEDMNKPSKRLLFESKLSDLILSKQLTTDYEIYEYSLSEGFNVKDSHSTLQKLKKERKIDFDFKLITHEIHKMSSHQPIKIL